MEKLECEICGERDKSTLHKHHIIERTDPNSTNHPWNLLVTCASCHNKIHRGNLKVLGLIPSTKKPYGRSVIYELNGIRNLDVEPVKISPVSMRINYAKTPK